MTLRSKVQLRWLFINKPNLARKWLKETKDVRNLPLRARPIKGKKP